LSKFAVRVKDAMKRGRGAIPGPSVEKLSTTFYHGKGWETMSNEEFVALIQAGDRDKLLDLWQQIRRLVLKHAHKWAVYRSGGAELEDLEQSGFVALMRAVDTFDTSAGFRFSTWYHRYMLAEFSIVTGRRTARQQRDPLHTAVSLDAQVGEDEDGSTLGELQPDPGAERAFEDVEHQMDNIRLYAVLMDAVYALAPCQRGAVMSRYFGGEPVENERKNLQLALRSLRHPRVSRQLRAFM